MIPATPQQSRRVLNPWKTRGFFISRTAHTLPAPLLATPDPSPQLQAIGVSRGVSRDDPRMIPTATRRPSVRDSRSSRPIAPRGFWSGPIVGIRNRPMALANSGAARWCTGRGSTAGLNVGRASGVPSPRSLPQPTPSRRYDAARESRHTRGRSSHPLCRGHQPWPGPPGVPVGLSLR